MGSINTDSTTINFNGANIKIATSGKGLIFADGTTLSSNTEIGGGGSSNLQQVVDLGNVTANTLLLENTGKTIVSSGNIESNIITTIIRFQEGSELPDGQGITLESAANNGNTVSNVVQFSNGLAVTSNGITYTGNIIINSDDSLSGISIGYKAGVSNQQQSGVAIGRWAGENGQNNYTVAIGNLAGRDGQNFAATALGTNAGQSNQGSHALALGSYAGWTNQGDYSVAIGHLSNAQDNSIVLNATGNALYPATTDGFFVKPVKTDTSKTSNVITYDKATGEFFDSGQASGGGGGSQTLQQTTDLGNTTTNVVQFSNGFVVSNGFVGIGTTSPSANLHVVGNVHATSTITSTSSDGTKIVQIRNDGGIEIIRTDSLAFIDFKNSSGEDYDFRIGQSGSDTLKFISANAGINLTFDGQYGSFGLNTSSPLGRLHIKQTTDDSGGDLDSYDHAGVTIERAGNTNKWSINHTSQQDMRFYYNLNSKALIRDNGTDDTNINFTGQHRCFNEFSNVSNLVGMIVCSKSNKYVNFDFSQSPTINECLPVISLSNIAYDKSCFGVISGKEDSGNRTTSSGAITTFLEQESGDNRVFVNSLGEGAIWVSNLNGNLESGDYITTSNIAGYGQKQDSEFLANYTVAKITMDCDFNPQMVPKRIIQKDADGNNVLDSNGTLILEDSDEMISEYEVKTLEDGTKVAFVGCTYHCG